MLSLCISWFSLLATNVGMIVGAVVGSLLGFLFLILLIGVFFLWKRQRDNEDDMANDIKWVHNLTAAAWSSRLNKWEINYFQYEWCHLLMKKRAEAIEKGSWLVILTWQTSCNVATLLCMQLLINAGRATFPARWSVIVFAFQNLWGHASIPLQNIQQGHPVSEMTCDWHLKYSQWLDFTEAWMQTLDEMLKSNLLYILKGYYGIFTLWCKK